MSHADLLALRIQQLERRPIDVARASEVIRKARLHSKEQFEKKFAHRLRKEAFQEGELVLVRNTAIEREMNRKHKPRYLGPYQVVRQTRNGAYIIKELNGDVSRESVAAFRLLAYHPSQQGLEELAGDPIEAVGAPQRSVIRNEEDGDLEWNDDAYEEDQSNEADNDEDSDDEPVGLRTRSQLKRA